MPSRQLHTQPIPADTQLEQREETRRRTREAGSLTGGTSPVESIAVEPGQTGIEVTYRGQRAKLLAKEVAGLFDAPAYDVVAYFGTEERTDEDGYYVMADSTDQPAETRAEGPFYTVAGTMRKRGTRRSHWRSVTTKVAGVENDVWEEEEARIGINDAARQVKWFDNTTGAVEPASVVETREAEHATVARYDPEDAPFDAPTLIFDLPYEEEGRADVRVWDDRGGPRTDAEGNVRWRKVYHPRYEPADSFVLANDLLRVYMNDETADPLTAERWDATAEEYEAVTLGTSDWEVAYVDVTRIGTARLEALVDFIDAETGEEYGLRATLTRGDERILWHRTENADGPTPEGLLDLLGPIAKTTRLRTGENDDLVPATEVER